MEKLSLWLNWDQIIALSQSTREKLVKEGIDKEKIKVVYGGVDYKKLSSLKFEKLKRRNIICIARLVKYKRIEDLILAFSHLSKKYPHLTLTIVGDGPERQNLITLIKNKNIESKVNLFQNISRNELNKLLKRAYIFCLPSIIEGFGLVTIEAASLATPYVIADIKVNKESTKNGQGGFLFKAQSPNDLAKKIDFLLSHKKIYQKKQVKALSLAKNYSWDKIGLATQKVYLKALK